MIDVAITSAELRCAEVAVVIDVLRATSTITQALAAGYRRVICAESIERALALRGPGRILAGERDCLAPPGFDQGNSPREAAQRRGRELVLATTNGTPTILAAAKRARLVLCGCLLNLDAVRAAVLAEVDPARDAVALVCSGTDGRPALEDVYLAGRLSALLPGPRSDAARIAEAVSRAYPDALRALAASEDARTLVRVGQESDIELCARESTLDVVPRLAWVGDGIGTLAERSGGEDPRAQDPGLAAGGAGAVSTPPRSRTCCATIRSTAPFPAR
jgi:2-phosphosulfolactate phosphatase